MEFERHVAVRIAALLVAAGPIFAFGYLFGFAGLLAVPPAAATAVLVRFALRRYPASPLYIGNRAV